MYSFEDHYKNILSKYYSRVFGGRTNNQQKNLALISALNIEPENGSIALDLGAGSGFYSIPLADKGFSVLAVDLDKTLLDEINSFKGDLSIQTICDDILNFESYTKGNKLDLILCMTDVISHFSSYENISVLFKKISDNLKSTGKFLLSFRDQSRDILGSNRFIPFYSDNEIIVTTFLEQSAEFINVTDIFYLRKEDKWEMIPGSYMKLRLYSETINDAIKQAGFKIIYDKTEGGLRYMLCLKD